MNLEIRNRLAALGRPLSLQMMQGTMDCYAELHARNEPSTAQVRRDCSYGPNERHRLDVFAPPGKAAAKRPVLIFVHGGGFVSGDKSRPGTPFYDNIGHWAAAHGFIGITMTYRLAPQHPWPSGAEDVGRAVEWVAQNIAEYGGNPRGIFLMGQSAGAVHVANYLTDARFHRASGRALAGGLLISGVYDVATADRNQFQKAYYGADDSLWGQFSSLPGLATTDLPLLVTVSELDPDDFQRQAAGYVAASLARKHEYPRMLYLQGHNHLSSVLQIGTAEDSLGPEIESFMNAIREQQKDIPPKITFPDIPLYVGWGRPLRVESDAVAMEVTQGEVPAELNGAWLRCGPDRQYPPRDGEDVFIDGEGQIHRFEFRDGQAHYRSRWVRTERFIAQEKARRALFGRYRNRYTSDPSVRHLSMGTANTTALWHGGKLLALKEDDLPYEIDRDTLATIGHYDYHGQVKSLTLSAHPKIDATTNELLTFGYQAKGDATDDIVFYVIGENQKIVNEIWFKMPFAATVHDFGVTDTHVIFPFTPLITDLAVIKAGGPYYLWHPEKGMHFAAVPRRGTTNDIQWFHGPAMGIGHTMNAFRAGNTLHLDATAYAGNMFSFFPVAKPGVLDYPQPSVGDGQPAVPPILSRVSLQLHSGSSDFTQAPLLKMPGEMPRIDDRYAGKAYRHGYLIVRPRMDANRTATLESAVGHIDHQTGALKIWEPGAHCSVHEPQFVPRSPTAAEGDGWLLVLVNRLDQHRNDLVILDAQTVEAGPVATIRMPVRVRSTFHGCWMPGANA